MTTVLRAAGVADVAAIAGFQTACWPSPAGLELMSLYVGAGQRGTGLAARLLEHAVGRQPAYLWVFSGNGRAQAFYRKHGFRPDGDQATDPDTGLREERYVRP